MADVYEAKVAKKFSELLNVADLDMDWIVVSFMNKGSNAQKRMYELCLAFLRHWAGRYRGGMVSNSEMLYPICHKAHVMLAALGDDEDHPWAV